MTLFVCINYVDAILNLFRVENALQFAHFACQLSISHCVNQVKKAISGNWEAPRSL